MLQTHAVPLSDEHVHAFVEGARVMAPARPGFRAGTVVKRLTRGHLLVRWDGNVLETLHHAELDWSDSDTRN